MSRKRRKLKIGKVLGRTALLALIVLTGWLALEILTWPDVAALAKKNPQSTAFIERYRHQSERDEKKPPLKWKWVSERAISSNLKRAVVVAEDMEFFSHNGFSEKEIRAAIEKAVDRREIPRGASTITQQLAKNLWLSPSRNPLRKIEEAILARQLEKHLTKRRILEIYLNVVELGPGIYGAEAASQSYFRKSAAQLSPREASALAAALPRPSMWHPGSKSRSYNRRVARVERMSQRASFLQRLVGGRTDEEVLASVPNTDDAADSVAQLETSPPLAEEPVVETSMQPPLAPLPPSAEADSADRMQKLLEELQRDMEILQEEERNADAADDTGTAVPDGP